MKILLWHVHGSWTTAFVQGGHEYLLPVTPDRDADGLGRARTWDWPPNARELTPAELAGEPVDVVILQRPHEIDLATHWLRRRPGIDVPAIYVEHNAPPGDVPKTVHPVAHRSDIPIAHVTHFNELFWDNGRAPHFVIEHGVLDPGPLYTGELERFAFVVNDPATRGRTVGTDLLPHFLPAATGIDAGVDVFGMRVTGLGTALMPDRPPGREILCEHEDVPQARLHGELARRRVYLHLTRWTSLGLSLIEAMTIGMPVVVLATTEAIEAVPPSAGVISTSMRTLTSAARRLMQDPDAARAAGRAAREAALSRYGIGRFLRDWDNALKNALNEALTGALQEAPKEVVA